MAEIRAELPRYDELQKAVADATRGMSVGRLLELGIGTGETTARVLAVHPGARLTAIDREAAMLERAAERLRAHSLELLRVGRLEEPLPRGPFDLVVSALVVHHLPAPEKRDLFRRIAAELVPGGRLVLGDVFVPARSEDAVTPLEPGVDVPDRLDDQLRWLEEAGLPAIVYWSWRDLAVVVGRRA